MNLAGKLCVCLGGLQDGYHHPRHGLPKLEDIDHDIILQIGEEIIAASEPKEDEVEDFSQAKKAN